MSKISILYSEQEIAKSVEGLGKRITEDFRGEKMLAVVVLNGAFVFAADLIRKIDNDMEIACLRAKSYIGTESSGIVKISGDYDFDNINLSDYSILLIEDILDTGKTLYALKEHFLNRGASSVRIAAFLDKKARRVADIEADYSCYSIEDKFVVGYGLDYDEKYRQLPYVGILDPNA